MKNFITSLTVFLIVFELLGQNLNGYKYAIVSPLIYQDGARDIYGMESKAISALVALGVKCLDSENAKDWPTDALEEPCLIAYVRFMYGDMPNAWNCGSVKVEIQNCKNQIISSELLKSKNAICYSPYECCYYKWAEAISTYFNRQTYAYNPSLNKLKTEFPEVEKTNETEETIRAYLSANKIDIVEGIYKSYQTESMPYYKLGIIKKDGKFKAIIIESDFKLWKPGEVKAVFEQSSMKGFYSVKWYSGNKTPQETFANMENEALLTVEFKDQKTEERRQSKFIKMFPAAPSGVKFKEDNSKASGSGFFITTGGILATNAHVVDGATNIEVTLSNEVGNFSYNAKVLIVDTKNDVALLQIDDEKFKGLTPIPFGIIEKSDVGEKVFTIGYPLNDVMGSNFKVTDGIISSKSGIADDIRYYQISVPLQPGNSGGPLFNTEGNVIGLTSARLNGQAIGTNIENVNYAIKSSYLLNLYNMLPNPPKLSSTSTIASKELHEQIKVLKNYVCLIKIF
jgi:S1-C subfamily serine protease